MKICVNLSQGAFLPVQCFSQYLSPENRLMMSSHGISKEQIVPFLYLVNNGDVEVKGLNVPERKVVFHPGEDEAFTSTISLFGIALLFISSEKKVLLAYEQFEDIFYSNYNFKHSNYYIFHAVDRDCILSYRKEGKVKFHAVNPKNSDTLRHNSRRGAHGIIANALLKGVTSLTSKLERDFKESEGVKYSLSFLLNGEESIIELVAEQPYEQDFDAYLSEHWTAKEPDIKLGPQKEGGCYIATACYHSYDHPSVLVLRKFRDDILLKNAFGRLFVKVYYKYSPFWANKLSAFTSINKLVRILFLDPVVKMLSGRTKK